MPDNDPTAPAFCVAAMYLFADLGSVGLDLPTIAECVRAQMVSLGIRGTIVLAGEGINGTVSGRRESIAELVGWLRQDAVFEGRLRELAPVFSGCASQVFARTLVKVRPEIVTMRRPIADPRRQVGAYVDPTQWNALVDDPDVLLIDARNDFEVRLGTFVSSDGRRSINPSTASFAEFPGSVERELGASTSRTVAMFCTGGIRCEKATSYLLAQGFEDVRHLRGGILGYLARVSPAKSRWEGACFVFDERFAVGHGLRPVEQAGSRPQQLEPRA